MITISPAARKLHLDALVIDAHADTPSEFFLREGYDFGRRHEEGHLDLPRLREGGVDLQFMIAWVPATLVSQPGAPFQHALALIEAIWDVAERTTGTRVITEMAELENSRRAGDVALMIGVEGGHAIENSLEKLQELHRRGARYLTLTWNNAHDWADSSTEPARHGGLTEFGREVIGELNRLQMVVDLSHASKATFYDTLEVSTEPVIASHSSMAAIAEHERNLDDDQIRALAEVGGVVGINFFPGFLDTEYGKAFEELEAAADRYAERLEEEGVDRESARREAREWRNERLEDLPPVGAERVIEHIERVVEIAGVEHVAIGSDFDGITTVPSGLPDVAAMPVITELLMRRGYRDDDIRAILGGNLLRLLESVIG